MRALSAPELLDVWERGLAQPPVQRALTLLAAAGSEAPALLANLSAGQRDGRLLALREWIFGPQLVSLAICVGCGERLELTFAAADLRVAPETESTGDLSLSADGYELRARLPNSVDLAAIADQKDPAAARQMLLERCVLTAEHSGDQMAAGQLPQGVVAALVERMAQADPQTDVRLALTCPLCKRQWEASFDIVSFFWSEINAWALRILNEVHALASAYGWREIDILNMSAWRRQFYLNLVSP